MDQLYVEAALDMSRDTHKRDTPEMDRRNREIGAARRPILQFQALS